MSNTTVLKQAYVTEDGKQFATKAEALAYLRRPAQIEALNKVTENNGDLTEWLIDNQDEIEGCFESTKIKRVTKVEKNQLIKALEAVAAAGDKAFAFLIENKEVIADSFRWPSVKRGNEEDQAATIKASFLKLTDDNSDLADWMVDNKDAVLAGFQAGIVKREVSPEAAKGLAEYQAKRKAGKEAAEAAAAKAEK